jgi:hypothetical protein
LFESTERLVAALHDSGVRSLAAKYHRNTLKAVGFPSGPVAQETRDRLEEGVSRLFTWLVVQAARGTKKLDAAIEQAERFRQRLAAFSDRGELMSIQAWLGRFGQDLVEEHPALGEMSKFIGEPARRWIDGFSMAQLLTLALSVSRYAKLGLSRAAVFVKLLCEDAGLFEDYTGPGGAQELFVPPDRTNLGLVRYLMRHDREFGRIFPRIVLKRVTKHPRGDESFFRLSYLAHRMLGDRAILLENLWFIGRYFHDSVAPLSAPGQSKAPVRRQACTVNEELVEQEGLVFGGIDVPEVCPLKARGCIYQGDEIEERQPSSSHRSERDREGRGKSRRSFGAKR